MFGQQFPNTVGSGYDAVAFSMILQEVNQASVDAAWSMADDREVIDALLRNIAQVDITTPSLATMVASSAAMNAVAASAKARDAIGTQGPAYDAVVGSGIALGKVVAAYAGLDPVDYADMDAVSASGTAMTAVVGSADARSFAIGCAEGMASMLASSTARAALIGSAGAMGDVLGGAVSRFAIWGSDDFLTEMLADSSAHDLARAAGALISKEAIQTDTIDLTAGVTGGNLSGTGKYLFLGFSYENSLQANITLQTTRAGSSISNVFVMPSSSIGTDALAVDIAIPIEGPTITFAKSTAGNTMSYFRVLDCTPPA